MVTPNPLLFVDHAAGMGGAEHSLLLLLAHLDRERFTPHLACPEGKLADAARARHIQVHVLQLPQLRRSLRAPLDWSIGIRSVVRIARGISAAVIISNTVRSTLYAGVAARLVRRPFVWHMRDFWLGEAQPRYLWADTFGKRVLCLTANRIIANSHATARHLPCPRKTTVVHNGIDIDRFDSDLDGGPFRRKHAIPSNAPVIGTVGRLRPWKGQDRLLRVLARVCETVPEVRGIIVGGNPFGDDDDYGTALRQIATDLHIRDRVIFTGQLPDPRPALAAMDIFVHPGDPEPFGLVNVEAMALAKPVVAFAHGALPEIVLDGETGRLIPPGDEAAMTKALVALLCASVHRTALGLAGRSRAVDKFSVTRAVREVESVLDTLLHE